MFKGHTLIHVPRAQTNASNTSATSQLNTKATEERGKGTLFRKEELQLLYKLIVLHLTTDLS